MRINKRLIVDDPATYRAARRVLEFQLFDVARRLPSKAVAKLRETPIWLERNEPHHPCAVYHLDVENLKLLGMNPDKARGVEISNADTYVAWTREHPSLLLHELAHAYHDRVVTDGRANAEILTAFARAKEVGSYDHVLSAKGRIGPAYATTDALEFFAEASEAYFGVNNFYPFVAAELRLHDPETFDLLTKLWGVE
ncbi:MAG: hypothetical protein QM811_18260 [Pirellulales bacterium]